MVTNLYLSRHGQTVWNIERRIQGRKDSPLTPLGIEQAKKLGDQLKQTPLQRIYASSSQRAWDTALYARGKRKVEIIKTNQLMEMDFGNWEGKKWSEIERLYPDERKIMLEHPEQYQAISSQGETYGEVEKRVVSFVEEILEKHSGENILLVSHGIVLKVLINYYRGNGIEFLNHRPHIPWSTLYQLSFQPEEVQLYFQGEMIGRFKYR